MHHDIIVKITNKMQLYRLIYYSKSAQHVLGNIFTHHQEHSTVFTVSGSVPNDGRKHRPKHVEPTWNNKLIYIVASCWLYSQLYHDARIYEH
jgi:hypothetical protein